MQPITEPALSNATTPPSPAPHRHAARLAKNIAANLLRQGTSWIIVLFVPPLLVRTMPSPSYATWMLVLQLGAYATLFDGGLQMAVSRFVARAHLAGDRTVLGEILSSAALLLTAAGNLVQPLIFVAATWSHGLPSLLRATLIGTQRIWEFARLTSAMMVSQLGMLLISGLDLPIVAAYDFRNAGYYAIATTLSNLLLVPQGAILTTLVPSPA